MRWPNLALGLGEGFVDVDGRFHLLPRVRIALGPSWQRWRALELRVCWGLKDHVGEGELIWRHGLEAWLLLQWPRVVWRWLDRWDVKPGHHHSLWTGRTREVLCVEWPFGFSCW